MLGFGKFYLLYPGLPKWCSGKESASSVRDIGLVPRSGRSPAEGNSNPLQYSWVEKPMDRGAWWAIVQGMAKSWIQLSTYIILPSPQPFSSLPLFHLLANFHKVFETQLRCHVFQEFFNFSWPQKADLTLSPRC